jgi:hypothetical protein
MDEPDYQEFSANEIPVETRAGGSRIKVIAGTTSTGVKGAVGGVPTAPVYFDVHLDKGAEFAEPVDADANACLYVYQGFVHVLDEDGDGTELRRGQLGRLGPGAGIRIRAGNEETRFLLLAALPLNEPVTWHGPFVMNTQQELREAIADYQSGRF